MAQGTGYEINCFNQPPLTGPGVPFTPENVRYCLYMYRILALLQQYSDINSPAPAHYDDD